MMRIDERLTAADLAAAARRVFEVAWPKILALDARWDAGQGTPVFTVEGRYATRGWTEWTQGFQYGMGVLAFDVTGDERVLTRMRKRIVERMAPHVSHRGVHDHGFNNISTYGNLRRLMREGKIAANVWEMNFYELALKASGAVQAGRWAKPGFIYSFNGPHSLFVDTIRSLRSLAVAHQLGHALMDEGDEKFSLLDRLVEHGMMTARHNVYYGEGRDSFDVPAERGRTCHEAIFNPNNGAFRCPSTQQGYSPFSTWTRGLAWAMLGFAEELEFLVGVPAGQFGVGGKQEVLAVFEKAARATCDFWIGHACVDGLCYWDMGAPGLAKMGDFMSRAAEPFNEHEPVDSSAAAIAAQGLIRLGRYLDEPKYERAGLAVARTLFAEPYLSADRRHEGLLLHSVYHRPNGWDHIPPGWKVPCGESSMWGDYHLLEAALLILRMGEGKYLTFFDRRDVA